MDTANGQVRQATNAEAFVIFGAGVLLAWAVLAVGAAVGYGVALLVRPVAPVGWAMLAWRDVVGWVIMYGMGGCLIEVARFQGPPLPGRYFRAWAAARRLRVGMYAVLALAAVGAGLFVALGPR